MNNSDVSQAGCPAFKGGIPCTGSMKSNGLQPRLWKIIQFKLFAEAGRGLRQVPGAPAGFRPHGPRPAVQASG